MAFHSINRINKPYLTIALLVGITVIVLIVMFSTSSLAALHGPKPLPTEYTTWVAKNNTGCGEYPYGVGQTAVASYFENRGIHVYEYRTYSLSDGGLQACDGHTLYLEVEDSDVQRMTSEFGFVSQMWR